MQKTLFTLILSLFVSTSAFAADKAKTKDDPKMQEMMKKMAEASTPNEHHKRLADMAGNWSYTSKMWESENATPEESKGTSKMKMILGGRWLQQDIKGKAMGMPFEGMGLTGYDNIKGQYETLWLDTMGTAAMKGTGNYDEASKTLKDSGQFTCPATGKDEKYRGEWKIIDKNNMVYTMYSAGMDGKGPEFKNMEMTFKRR